MALKIMEMETTVKFPVLRSILKTTMKWITLLFVILILGLILEFIIAMILMIGLFQDDNCKSHISSYNNISYGSYSQYVSTYGANTCKKNYK